MKEQHAIPLPAAALFTGTGFTDAVDAFADASLGFSKRSFFFQHPL